MGYKNIGTNSILVSHLVLKLLVLTLFFIHQLGIQEYLSLQNNENVIIDFIHQPSHNIINTIFVLFVWNIYLQTIQN